MRELVDNEVLFDTILVSLFAGLASGRLVHFLLHSEIYRWSILRILFFTTYTGIDFFGSFIGVFIASFIYLRSKREKPFFIFDLAAAPIAFGQFLFNLGLGLSNRGDSFGIFGSKLPVALAASFSYLLLFWSLKRFEKKKRFVGFFSSVYLIGNGTAILIQYIIGPSRGVIIFGKPPYYLIIGALFIAVGLLTWYVFAKRNLRGDTRAFFAQSLLTIFSLKRILTSADEAGRLSRGILFLPYFLLRSLCFLAMTLAKEARLSLVDLMHAAFGQK